MLPPFARTVAPPSNSQSVLDEDARLAVATSAFKIDWDPIVGCRTGDLLGFEATPQWDRPGHDSMPAAALRTLLGRLGLGRRFDSWLLRRVGLTASAWRRQSVSVSLFGTWLQQPGLIAEVAGMLERSGMNPALLELQFSESAIRDAGPEAGRDLGLLKQLGVGLSLSGFGSGLASLEILQTMPFDKIRLDPSFVHRLGQCRRAEAIIRAVLQMGCDLGVTVCAEGIDRPEQLAILQAYDCDQGQGSLLGEPSQGLPDMLDLYDRLDQSRLFLAAAPAFGGVSIGM